MLESKRCQFVSRCTAVRLDPITHPLDKCAKKYPFNKIRNARNLLAVRRNTLHVHQQNLAPHSERATPKSKEESEFEDQKSCFLPASSVLSAVLLLPRVRHTPYSWQDNTFWSENSFLDGHLDVSLVNPSNARERVKTDLETGEREKDARPRDSRTGCVTAVDYGFETVSPLKGKTLVEQLVSTAIVFHSSLSVCLWEEVDYPNIKYPTLFLIKRESYWGNFELRKRKER